MNKRLSFLNQTTFRIYSYKYKPFFVPLAINFVCLLLFITIIIPQIQQWFDVQQQIAFSQRKIDVLTQNLTLAGKINASAADSYLQIVTKALPTNKDFIGILAAVSNAAVDSAISLQDYSFAVGDLSGNNQDALLTLPVTISIKGSLEDVKRFAIAIKKQLPLSQITDINFDGNVGSNVSLVFYYKPFPAEVSFQPAQPLQTLTDHEQSLLREITTLDSSSKQSALAIQERLINQ